MSPGRSSDQEKLKLLRQLDQFRDWQSLDDERYCLECGKIINGHEIHLVGDIAASDGVHPICPTESCHSIPMDWVLPTGVLADIAMHKGRLEKRPQNGNMIETHEHKGDFK